jgi:ribonuclease P protein component
MLPKLYRLLADKDFQKIWKKGRSFYAKNLGFKVLTNSLDVSRFGISVGLKVSKRATDRNRLKRQLREILSSKIGQITPGFDIIITVLPVALGKTYAELQKDVEAGLKYFKI